ncbi:MAG: M16 family metallopeptidase, partial [Candidatus Acidiferrales bacterium]
RAYPMAHEKRFVMALLSNVLGGGTSSRLFQSVRERQGLAYSVYSDLNLYRDAGTMTVYAGTSLPHAEKVIRTIVSELRLLKQEPVPPDELQRVKDNVRGSLLLSLESTGSRMHHVARQEIFFGQFHTVEQLLGGIEAVTAEEVQALAQEFFHTDAIAATLVGNLEGFRLKRDMLAC